RPWKRLVAKSTRTSSDRHTRDPCDTCVSHIASGANCIRDGSRPLPLRGAGGIVWHDEDGEHRRSYEQRTASHQVASAWTFAVISTIVGAFVRADALAIRYQRRPAGVVTGVWYFATFAVTVASVRAGSSCRPAEQVLPRPLEVPVEPPSYAGRQSRPPIRVTNH